MQRLQLQDIGLPVAQGSQKQEADALETFVGGLLEHEGYEVARGFVRDQLVTMDEAVLREALPHRNKVDPKRALREHRVARSESLPQYTLLHDRGPRDKENRFVSSVSGEGVVDDVLGQGVGRTIKASEKAAAMEALDAWYLSRRPKLIIPVFS